MKNDKRPNDYLLSGYYGCNNFGDDLTLECLMNHLSEKKGAVLTCNPAKTHVSSGIDIIHRFSMYEIHKLMRKTRVFLMGCGSIFQDTTSFRSFIYYYVVMRMAFFNRCKTMLYANGIGPITRKGNVRRMKYLLKRIDCITVRDKDSYDFLKEIGGGNNVYLAADDSFSYAIPEIQPITPPKAAEGKKICGLNLMISENASSEYLSALSDALSALAKKHNLYYYVLPFHYEQDYKMLKKLADMMPNTAKFIEDANTPNQIISYIAAADFQIFERLHGQILSTILGIPYLAINYDLKIAAFARQAGIEEYLLNIENLDKEHLIYAFEKIMEHQEHFCNQLKNYSKVAKERVCLNRENLLKLIEER